MASTGCVFVTCGSRAEARRIARELVRARAAACVNITGPVESVYRWQGKIEKAKEFLLIIKTRSARFDRVLRLVQKHHSYTCPEIVMLPIVKGSKLYLGWIKNQT